MTDANPPAPDTAPLVYDVSASGHRRRGAEVVAKTVDGTVLLEAPGSAFRRLLRHRGPLIWQTADYEPVEFTKLALCRSLFGRRSIAICFRNNFNRQRNHLRNILSEAVFWLWRRLPFCTAFTTCPRSENLSSDAFLFDTEWWDVTAMPVPIVDVPPLQPGPTLMFMGTENYLKGFPFFLNCAVAAAARQMKWNFVIVGSTHELNADQRAAMNRAGVKTIEAADDRVFLTCLRRAHLLWCCYNPAYDQSSGIFGRAVQFGVPTIVRKNSLLAECQIAFGRGIAVDYGDVDGLLASLDRPFPEPARALEKNQIYEQARHRLRQACNLPAVASDHTQENAKFGV